MTAKKAPARYCESRGLKAKFKNTHAQYGAFAFQSQISDLRVTHLVVRFGLAPSMAAIFASLAWREAR